MGAGTATASLTAEFPGGANRTVGAVDAAVAAGNLAASNGTADCAGAFDVATGRFPAAVTAGDAAYVQRDRPGRHRDDLDLDRGDGAIWASSSRCPPPGVHADEPLRRNSEIAN